MQSYDSRVEFDRSAWRLLPSEEILWEGRPAAVPRDRLWVLLPMLFFAIALVSALFAKLLDLAELPGVSRTIATAPGAIPRGRVGVRAVVWLGPGGIADRVLGGLPIDLGRDPRGAGIVLVYVFKETPFLALLVLAAWGPAVAARDEAAAVLACGEAVLFWIWEHALLESHAGATEV